MKETTARNIALILIAVGAIGCALLFGFIFLDLRWNYLLVEGSPVPWDLIALIIGIAAMAGLIIAAAYRRWMFHVLMAFQIVAVSWLAFGQLDGVGPFALLITLIPQLFYYITCQRQSRRRPATADDPTPPLQP